MFVRLSYFARETLVSLRRNLLMTIAGVLTVAVSLALFGGIMLLSRWVDRGTEQIKGDVRLELFMKVDATQAQIDDVESALDNDENVKSFRFISKAQAYEEAKILFRDNPEILRNTSTEFLPPSFRVTPIRAEFTSTVKDEFSTMAGVEDAASPDEALRGILEATDTARIIFIGLSIVLLASSLFLIVNTIRLATFARRREIEVMKLVGASNWFVRVPFMAEGMVQGLMGAGLAIGVVVALKVFGFDQWFHSDDPGGNLFSRFYVTTGDDLVVALYVLVLGAFIGTMGAVVGLRRFLRV
jgi:cell division transport system permease protein